MVEFRLTKGYLQVEFEENVGERFEVEFNQIHSAIDEWVSVEKAKTSGESDPLLVKLLVGIYKKLDELGELIKSEKNPREGLKFKQTTNLIGFEGFGFEKEYLQEGQIYFAKLFVPSFVRSQIPVFFKAVDSKTAQIIKITPSDEKEWSQFVARNEIIEIRKAKIND